MKYFDNLSLKNEFDRIIDLTIDGQKKFFFHLFEYFLIQENHKTI